MGFATYRITDFTPILPDIEEKFKISPNLGLSGGGVGDRWFEERKSLYKPLENLLKPDQLLWIQNHLQQNQGNQSTDPEAGTHFQYRDFQKTPELYIEQ